MRETTRHHREIMFLLSVIQPPHHRNYIGVTPPTSHLTAGLSPRAQDDRQGWKKYHFVLTAVFNRGTGSDITALLWTPCFFVEGALCLVGALIGAKVLITIEVSVSQALSGLGGVRTTSPNQNSSSLRCDNLRVSCCCILNVVTEAQTPHTWI